MLSSQTPVIVTNRDGKVVLVTGSPGKPIRSSTRCCRFCGQRARLRHEYSRSGRRPRDCTINGSPDVVQAFRKHGQVSSNPVDAPNQDGAQTRHGTTGRCPFDLGRLRKTGLYYGRKTNASTARRRGNWSVGLCSPPLRAARLHPLGPNWNDSAQQISEQPVGGGKLQRRGAAALQRAADRFFVHVECSGFSTALAFLYSFGASIHPLPSRTRHPPSGVPVGDQQNQNQQAGRASDGRSQRRIENDDAAQRPANRALHLARAGLLQGFQTGQGDHPDQDQDEVGKEERRLRAGDEDRLAARATPNAVASKRSARIKVLA